MKTVLDNGDEELRRRQAARATQRLPEFLDRLAWSTERLHAERQARLRELLSVAKKQSPWHRGRLVQIDCERATERDLASIPPMTKDDLMRNFDATLTDANLSRGNVEAHLEAGSGGYLLEQYRVVASGGSSGNRGVFVYDWDGWATVFLALARFRVAAELAAPVAAQRGIRAAIVAAKPVHMSYALGQTFGAGATVNVPATLPLPEIVGRINELQPTSLVGYATMLNALAQEALEGRLRIRPRLIIASSEPLLPEIRVALERAWQAPVLNLYATSEGATAGACADGRGLHLSEDLCIFEPVDRAGRPVAAGRAAKVLVTRLFNHVQPLIRYEITDELTLLDEPCACGSNLRRVEDIAGRSDDMFFYGPDIGVHPQSFRSVLGQQRRILEYQVRQTHRGAAVAVKAVEEIESDAIGRELERELAQLGVREPLVSVEVVERFERESSGKLRRFFPISRR